MKVVVMAGGEGSRLRPLTIHRPKPLVPVGTVPIMEHIVNLLRRHGLTQLVATLYYLGDEIEAYFGDGRDFGVNIDYSVETSPLGTAGSVKKAERLIGSDPFVIISGDALTDCDLTAAIAAHRAKGAMATLILHRVPRPLEFGVVICDDQGFVKQFLEKPSWSEVFSDTVNTGMYILEPEIFEWMDHDTPYDWSADIFPRLLEAKVPLYGHVMNEYWADVGSLSQYMEAQEDLLSGRVNLPVMGEIPHGRTILGPNAVVEPGASLIPPVVLGRNVRVKRGAKVGPYVCIGENGIVQEDAVLERSNIWEGCYIGPQTSIQGATIGSRTTVKKDTAIREEAVVADRCLIDVGCTIRTRVKIWPDKIIDRGSIVNMSIIHGSRWRGSLFRELGVAGLSNVEVTPDFACRLGAAYGTCFPSGSRIVASRDSTRSSRMIKRALISALLSSGCDVLDMRSAPVPVVRRFVQTTGAAGAMNVRKLPGNSRVTLMEMFDSRGAYASRAIERKVEAAFYREDFKRTDPDDLGSIYHISRAIEEYQSGYMSELGSLSGRSRFRIVCDYGYSAIAGYMPAILHEMGVENVSVNSFSDGKRAPRNDDEVGTHVAALGKIVSDLDFDMGALFLQEGERLILVDPQGRAIQGHTLFGVLGALICQANPEAMIAMSVAAPKLLEDFLVSQGGRVLRTKADTRSLMESSTDWSVDLAGDDRGGFIFPSMHPGFDAAFALGTMLARLSETETSLSELIANVPAFYLAYEQVRVPWDSKGKVMRQLVEGAGESHIELLDGVKLFDGDAWVLVLPDSLEPSIHIYAESPVDPTDSSQLIRQYATRIADLI